MKKIKSTNILKFTALSIVLMGILFFLLLTFVFPYVILQPKRNHQFIAPESISKNFEQVSLSIEGVGQLRGYFFKPIQQPPRAIIILIHGVGGAKEHFFKLAAKLKDEGFASVALDNRAHGESDGEYVTYGYFEKYDVAQIVSFLKVKYPDTPIGVWGASMGGAIGLQAMELDARIEFGVIESTFTNLPQITYDYQKRYSAGLGLRFATDFALERAGKIAKFDPLKVSPLASVKNIEQPVFFAHGRDDRRISHNYGKQLYDAVASQEKYWEVVEGAGHLNVGKIGGEDYYQKILIFIENQL